MVMVIRPPSSPLLPLAIPVTMSAMLAMMMLMSARTVAHLERGLVEPLQRLT